MFSYSSLDIVVHFLPNFDSANSLRFVLVKKLLITGFISNIASLMASGAIFPVR
jgi:hypothetical protein